MARAPHLNTPILAPQALTADTTPVRVVLPEANNPLQRVVITVHESAGPVELISDATQTKGLTIPTVTVTDENFLAGEYTLRDLELWVYASSSTALTIVAVIQPG